MIQVSRLRLRLKPRTEAQTAELVAAGYNPNNHPQWMKLAGLRQIKTEARAAFDDHVKRSYPRLSPKGPWPFRVGDTPRVRVPWKLLEHKA